MTKRKAMTSDDETPDDKGTAAKFGKKVLAPPKIPGQAKAEAVAKAGAINMALAGSLTASSSSGGIQEPQVLEQTAQEQAPADELQELLLAVVSRGLAPKVCLGLIPEGVALMNGMHRIIQISQDAMVVSRTFIVLRHVRGTHGVPWVTGFLEGHWEQMAVLEPPAFTQALWEAFLYETEANRRGKFTWASHIEHHHTRLSGGYFLDALRTDTGLKGWLKASSDIEPIVQEILRSPPGAPQRLALQPDTVLKVMKSMEGVVALAKNPRAASGFSFDRDYNSMDAARALINWAVFSGRAEEPPLTPEVFLGLGPSSFYLCFCFCFWGCACQPALACSQGDPSHPKASPPAFRPRSVPRRAQSQA
jgi:hypothetical protein